MYQISVETNLSAAHQLIGYPGDCSRIHGHNWTIIARVSATELNSLGIAFDFRDLKNALFEIVDRYDHRFLNEVSPFNRINPTSENMARYIFEGLKTKIPDSIHVLAVEVRESDKCAVIYSED